MVSSAKNTFTGFFSQLVVVCLLAVFIVLVLVAMYTTSAVANDMAWIGMTVEPLGAETAAALGIPSNMGGVIVGEVEGMAARAGVRHGDVVQGIGGNPVRDMTDFAELTKQTDLSKGGVQLVVNRRGVQLPVFVYPPTGAAQPLGPTAPAGRGQAPAVINRQWLGIEAETLTAGEARGLGIPAGVAGVLVETVTKGSKAAQAGLANNDVIVSVNGQRTDSTTRLWALLAALRAGDPVEFSVYRNGQLKFVSLPTASGAHALGFNVPNWQWGMGGAQAAGLPGQMGAQGTVAGGMLVCPNCGTRVIHQQGMVSYAVPCPSCGTQMVRSQ